MSKRTSTQAELAETKAPVGKKARTAKEQDYKLVTKEQLAKEIPKFKAGAYPGRLEFCPKPLRIPFENSSLVFYSDGVFKGSASTAKKKKPVKQERQPEKNLQLWVGDDWALTKYLNKAAVELAKVGSANEILKDYKISTPYKKETSTIKVTLPDSCEISVSDGTTLTAQELIEKGSEYKELHASGVLVLGTYTMKSNRYFGVTARLEKLEFKSAEEEALEDEEGPIDNVDE